MWRQQLVFHLSVGCFVSIRQENEMRGLALNCRRFRGTGCLPGVDLVKIGMRATLIGRCESAQMTVGSRSNISDTWRRNDHDLFH